MDRTTYDLFRIIYRILELNGATIDVAGRVTKLLRAIEVTLREHQPN